MRLAGKTLILVFLILLTLPNLSIVNFANVQISAAASVPSATDAKFAWNRTYTDSDLQSVASAFQTGDGGFLLAGITASNGIPAGLKLMKIDSSGNPLWSKVFPGTASGDSNFAKWAVQTNDGGYAIAGRSEGKAWLAKLDDAGNMQWNKTILASNSAASTLSKASDGGFVLTGYSLTSNVSSASIWLIKTDASGNQQLYTVLNGPTTGVNAIIQTSDGGFAFSTETSHMILERGEIKTDCTLTKLDSKGVQQWSQVYPDFGFAWTIIQTKDGDYVLGGGKGIALLKANSVGAMQWNQSYDSGQAWVMAQTSDNGFVLAGTAMVKTDAAGNEQWALNLPDKTHTYTVVEAKDGGYLCAGQLVLGSESERTSWVAKINNIPTQSPTPTSNSSLTPTLSPSPSVSELSWLIIVPLLLSIFAIAIIVKNRKSH